MSNLYLNICTRDTETCLWAAFYCKLEKLQKSKCKKLSIICTYLLFVYKTEFLSWIPTLICPYISSCTIKVHPKIEYHSTQACKTKLVLCQSRSNRNGAKSFLLKKHENKSDFDKDHDHLWQWNFNAEWICIMKW